MLAAEADDSVRDPSSEVEELILRGRVHGAFELGCVGLERREFHIDMAIDGFEVVWCVGFPQQQRVWSVVGEAVVSEEVRIARGDDALARKEASVAVIRVDPVPLPRVMAEDNIRSNDADLARNLTT